MSKLMFTPAVIKTKEELLVALKNGKIQSSKFNLLDEDEQMFIQLVVFGNYKHYQAMQVIKPQLADPAAAGRRMMNRQDVVDVLEELTYKRDKLWLASVTGSREVALNTLEYIMKTTDDDGLKAAVAKTIIEAADKAIKSNQKPEEQVNGITFNIEFAPQVNTNVGYNPKDLVIIQGDDDKSSGMPYSLDYANNIKASYSIDAIEIEEEEEDE